MRFERGEQKESLGWLNNVNVERKIVKEENRDNKQVANDGRREKRRKERVREGAGGREGVGRVAGRQQATLSPARGTSEFGTSPLLLPPPPPLQQPPSPHLTNIPNESEHLHQKLFYKTHTLTIFLHSTRPKVLPVMPRLDTVELQLYISPHET